MDMCQLNIHLTLLSLILMLSLSLPLKSLGTKLQSGRHRHFLLSIEYAMYHGATDQPIGT